MTTFHIPFSKFVIDVGGMFHTAVSLWNTTKLDFPLKKSLSFSDHIQLLDIIIT